MIQPEGVLDFWFGDGTEDRTARWFGADPGFDEAIRARFGAALEEARAGRLDHWAETPRGRLALIILLDQFSRNLHRGDGRSFENDARAQRLVREGLERGDDRALSVMERAFFYMPLQHAEDRELQALSVECFRRLRDEAPPEMKKMTEGFYEYAVRHKVVVDRFGRFPHRNALLGRPSTPEEQEFLASPRAPF